MHHSWEDGTKLLLAGKLAVTPQPQVPMNMQVSVTTESSAPSRCVGAKLSAKKLKSSLEQENFPPALRKDLRTEQGPTHPLSLRACQ